MKRHIQDFTTFSVNEGRRGASYAVSIEHTEGSKFGPAGSEDGYEIENAPNLLAAINQALENYGIRVTHSSRDHVSIEHTEGSKFGPAGSEDGYDIESSRGRMDSINQALGNYGLRITYAGA